MFNSYRSLEENTAEMGSIARGFLFRSGMIPFQIEDYIQCSD